jgi:hypothetical protein
MAERSTAGAHYRLMRVARWAMCVVTTLVCACDRMGAASERASLSSAISLIGEDKLTGQRAGGTIYADQMRREILQQLQTVRSELKQRPEAQALVEDAIAAIAHGDDARADADRTALMALRSSP